MEGTEPPAVMPLPLARPRHSVEDLWLRSFRLIWIAALGVACWTFLDYGVTWDEDRQRVYAEMILRWIQTLGRDRDALHFTNMYLYGGIFEVPAQLFGSVFPAGVFEGRHLLNVLVGLSGIWGTFRLGTCLGGSRVGFFAGMFLLFTPLYYGHSFSNPKDIPFAVFSVWALLAMVRAAEELPRISWRSVLWTGVALGLVLGVRVAGLFHVGYLALLWGSGLLMHHLRSRKMPSALVHDTGRMALALASVVVVAWVVMLLCWPYGQVDPLINPIQAAIESTRFDFNADVLFNGRFINAKELPWTYLPVYFGVSLPEHYFLGLCAGGLTLLFAWRSGRNIAAFATLWKPVFLLFVILFPIAGAILTRSTLYDGLRHFLFVMPPLAVLAGLGLSTAIDAIRWRWARAGMYGLVGGLLAWVAVDMVALHPYQSVYYNRLVAGGLAGAAGRFETDYWASSYREAVEWVVAHYDPETSEPIRIANCSDPFITRYYLDKQTADAPRFIQATDGPRHVFITTTRFNCHLRQGARLLHVVRRQGVNLAYVFETSRPPPP